MHQAVAGLGGILVSPGVTIERIRDNPKPYFVTSAIILVAVSFFTINSSDWGMQQMAVVEKIAKMVVVGTITNIVTIIMIYFVGGRLGTKSRFQSVFCTMSYAAVPLIIGGVIMMGIFLAFLPGTEESQTGEEVDMLQLVVSLVYMGVPILPFFIWKFIIMIKAIKRVHGVGVPKAILITIIAIIISSIVAHYEDGMAEENTMNTENTSESAPMSAEVTLAISSPIPGCDETNECYIPYSVTIGKGGTVTWINDYAGHTVTGGDADIDQQVEGIFEGRSTSHTVTAGDLKTDPTVIGENYPNGFDSGLFLPGNTFSHKFTEAGTYPYFCTVHPWMKGIVIVQ